MSHDSSFSFPAFRVVIPWIPALLVTMTALYQRFPYIRRISMRWLLFWGTGSQLAFLLLLAHGGGSPGMRIFSCAALLVYNLTYGIDFIYFRITGSAFGWDILWLGFRERRYVRTIALCFLRIRDWLFLGLLVGAAFSPALSSGQAHRWTPLLCGTAGVIGLALMGGKAPPPSGALNAFGRLIGKIFSGMRSEKNKVFLPRRPFPAPTVVGGGKRGNLNILVVLHESLGRTLLDGPGREATPFLRAFMRENEARLFDFPMALSNTGASDISYPSIFSGLSPLQSREQFETHPLIWAGAKAAGYTTSFFTAWDMSWAGLQNLIVDEHVDLIVDPVVMKEPLVNELGVDDRTVARHAVRYLERVRGPFFSVVAYNGQHMPCLMVDRTCARYDLRTHLGRYLNSLTILDQNFERLIETLRKSGKLENTAIFFMSDHGEMPGYFDSHGTNRHGHSPRVNDFNHDILSVPFWIYLPERSLSSSLVSALRENSRRIVSNLDFYPTALSVMGWGKDAKINSGLNLGGHDLLRTLPRERSIPCVNTGSLRSWNTSPVALAHGTELLIYHDTTQSLELLDLQFPQRGNLWLELSFVEKERWLKRMADAGVIPPIIRLREPLMHIER